MLQYAFQWHITAKCDQRCRHCYMYDSLSYESERSNQLSLTDCLRALKKIEDFKIKLSKLVNDKVSLGIVLSGGDPILEPFFFELLSSVKLVADSITILGNSYHIDETVAKKLRQLSVGSYQISVDGLKETHDAFRKKGSFNDAFRALKILREAGIRENIMMTVSPENIDEVFPLVEYAASKDVSRFGFARIAEFGNAKDMPKRLQPLAYRKFLLKYLWYKGHLKKRGASLNLSEKDHLFKLLKKELRLYKPVPGEHDGCHMVRNHLSILADGTIYACRRFPNPLGNIKNDDLFKVYQSQAAQKFTDYKNFEKCRSCELGLYCRGCPAVAHGVTGSAFKADPQCWK